MHWNTTQAKLKALENNGVAACYYCDKFVAINPKQDHDIPMLCDYCIEAEDMPEPFDIGEWADMVC